MINVIGIDIENVLVTIKWDEYDAIIISDYCKGFINEYDIEYIAQAHPLTFLDTKRILGIGLGIFLLLKLTIRNISK